ncbi:MAG TPA: alpha/beta hydrolase [Flavisolibacter sp.]|nr:alpha/beta hydrolase [Flavisolibacter sp.]
MFVDLDKLSRFNRPALLTYGTESPPFFYMAMEQIAKALPHAIQKRFEGAGHVPHLSHSQKYIEVVSAFCSGNGLSN